MTACVVDGCLRAAHARALCPTHYSRWWRHGNPLESLSATRGLSIEARFWRQVDQDGPVPAGAPGLGPCWLWTGRLDAGYGRMYLASGAGRVGAHRFSYELHISPIPEGLHIDHLCRTPACVNPAHLEPVTPLENTLRGAGPSALNARKTHCLRGHLFDESNTRWRTDFKRSCRTCETERQIQRRRAVKRQGVKA